MEMKKNSMERKNYALKKNYGHEKNYAEIRKVRRSGSGRRKLKSQEG